MIKPGITINLWFDKQAEEAANFYTSIFRNSKVGRTSHYGKEGFEIHGMPEGSVLTVEFELNGQKFLALNGGPVFKFNEAVSMVIECETQEDIDYYWDKLTEGGDPASQQCGWLKDKYGVSWQVTPSAMGEMMSDPDIAKTERVMKAFMPMKKLEIQPILDAYKGVSTSE